ncbi:DUF11 domain-containing protein, partial [Lampropedia puyangensis]|uniref:DUF11 domain-containing protein n=1 Tax=Lampropedia puyangensis TaxID=1330072 RepID=UPI001B862B59
KAFYAAATDPAGACKQPVVNVPDLAPVLTGASALNIGTPSSVTLTVNNTDQATSSGGIVTVTLPAGIELVNPPATCTTSASPAGFSCPIPALAVSGSETFNFDIRAITLVNDAPIAAEVSAVADEVNIGNNTTSMLLSSSGAPDLTSSITGDSTLSVGVAGNYTVMVNNGGNLGSTDGVLTVILPAGL